VGENSAIRVLLVDDHVIVREGLMSMLSLDSDFEVVGEAGDGEEAVKLYAKLKPDVVLMDVRLPGLDGFEALRKVKLLNRRAVVLMFAASNLAQEVKRARQLGAAGFLCKDVEFRDLSAAIKDVWSGRSCWAEPNRSTHPCVPELTEREFQVLESARRGLSNADIGRVLSISEHTVKSHVKTLLKKLDAADRAEAVARGFELGFLR
jgi:DNA-binding NarL/FixJ family response regulator